MKDSLVGLVCVLERFPVYREDGTVVFEAKEGKVVGLLCREQLRLEQILARVTSQLLVLVDADLAHFLTRFFPLRTTITTVLSRRLG